RHPPAPDPGGATCRASTPRPGPDPTTATRSGDPALVPLRRRPTTDVGAVRRPGRLTRRLAVDRPPPRAPHHPLRRRGRFLQFDTRKGPPEGGPSDGTTDPRALVPAGARGGVRMQGVPGVRSDDAVGGDPAVALVRDDRGSRRRPKDAVDDHGAVAPDIAKQALGMGHGLSLRTLADRRVPTAIAALQGDDIATRRWSLGV